MSLEIQARILLAFLIGLDIGLIVGLVLGNLSPITKQNIRRRMKSKW